MPDDAVRNLIRQAKVEQIYSVMQTSTSRGMQTMEQSLADLVLRNVITAEIAFARSSRPDQLQGLLERSGPDELRSTGRRQRQHRRRQDPSRERASARPGGVERPVDLNKEIKLSDLVRLPKKKKPAGVVKPSNGKRKRRRKQEIVGLKIGASQIAASRVVNNGSAKLVQLARVPLAPGVVVGGEVRDVEALATALDSFFTRQQASAPGHPARHRQQPHRRAHGRHRRCRGRAPARQRRSVQSARGSLDPARPGRPRLPRRQRDGRTSPGPSHGASCSRPPTRSRSTTTSRRAGRRASSSRASTSRRSRCCAQSRRATATWRRTPPRRLGRRLDRSRPLDAGDLRRNRLRLHARSRLGRLEARGCDRAGARRSPGPRQPSSSSSSISQAMRLTGTIPARRSPAPRSNVSCRRLRVSWSPHSTSTRASPAHSPSPRSSSPAVRRGFRDWPRSSSG